MFRSSQKLHCNRQLAVKQVHPCHLLLIFMFMWPCIVMNFFLIKPTHALIFQIYFYQETLHVSGSPSAHHQEFSTVHSALVYVMQVWWQHVQDGTWVPSWTCFKAVVKLAWHIPVPNVQWRTPDDGQRDCPKRVEFLDKNKFGKLVCLLILLKRNCLYFLNTFTAIVDLSRFNNSCLRSPASTLVDLTFQSRALRSFSLNQLRNLSL